MKYRVLLISNAISWRTIYARHLEASGLGVLVVDNLKEAALKVGVAPPDLLILHFDSLGDRVLRDAAEFIRCYARIPVLCLTPGDATGRVKAATGAAACLSSTASPRVVRSTVDEILLADLGTYVSALARVEAVQRNMNDDETGVHTAGYFRDSVEELIRGMIQSDMVLMSIAIRVDGSAAQWQSVEHGDRARILRGVGEQVRLKLTDAGRPGTACAVADAGGFIACGVFSSVMEAIRVTDELRLAVKETSLMVPAAAPVGLDRIESAGAVSVDQDAGLTVSCIVRTISAGATTPLVVDRARRDLDFMRELTSRDRIMWQDEVGA